MAEKKITDEALLAFVQWCRMNDARLVSDPVIARQVFNAYRLLPALNKKVA